MQKQEGLSINWKAVTADRLLQNGLSPKNTAIVITTIENVIAHQIKRAKAERDEEVLKWAYDNGITDKKSFRAIVNFLDTPRSSETPSTPQDIK